MDYIERFHKRISELRMQKGVSARDMSLSLGQSASYVNKIENRRTLPSVQGFFYICEYLNISPREFFDFDVGDPIGSRELLQELGKLTPRQIEHIMLLVKDFSEK
jgi:transcriptional regulator with XRE-family HTH domain